MIYSVSELAGNVCDLAKFLQNPIVFFVTMLQRSFHLLQIAAAFRRKKFIKRLFLFPRDVLETKSEKTKIGWPKKVQLNLLRELAYLSERPRNLIIEMKIAKKIF